MPEQPDLFAAGPLAESTARIVADTKAMQARSVPYVNHSITSKAAACEIATTTGALRLRVLEALRAAGTRGATDEELQEALDMIGSTQRPRRIELVAAGLVRDTEQKRKTRSGRLAVVWGAV